LTSPVQERVQRIVDTAVELAEQGGFENVRLRQVASSSGVALGTLYRHFSSKEDLLLAALAQEMQALEAHNEQRPPEGEPTLARAVLRAVASGDHELTEKVARFHSNLEAMVVAAMRGPGAETDDAGDPAIAEVLEDVWFSALVGWAGGLHGQSAVVEKVHRAAALVLRVP
jgi:AcrR family transcriptional regulator